MNLSRLSASAIIAVLALGAAADPAEAQIVRPRLKVVDRGDKVEVIVTGVQLPATPTMKVNRERIELPLAGRPNEVNDSYGAGLVWRIDVRGEGLPKTLSVKLRRDHAAVMALAQTATATQADDGVHLFIPKTPPAAATASPPTAEKPAATGTTVTLADTTATAAPATDAKPTATTATAAPTTAATGTTVTLAGVTSPAEPTNANAASADAGGATTTSATGDASAAAEGAAAKPDEDGSAIGSITGHKGSGSGSRPGKLTGGASGPGIGRVVLAIVAIALAGGAIVALRKRKGAAPTAPGPQLDILATKSLGGKTRIVWLGAGDRELVVAVANTNVSLLGQWRRGEADRPLERSMRLGLEAPPDDEPSFAAGSTQLPRTRTLNTSAVSGIMRLRGKVSPITDDLAADDTDADEKWARDILAATGGRR